MDSSRPKTNDKDKFQFRISEKNVMLRFKLDVNFVHSLKFHLINIFPSLAILSHVDKTKIFKFTPNIPP